MNPNKLIRYIAVFLILLPCAAIAYNGVVLKIESSEVIVKIEQADGDLSGAVLDMTYKAGLLPMDMGRYKVRSITEGVAQLIPVSVNTPPSEGMNVMLDMVSSPTPPRENQGKTVIGEVVETDNDIVNIKLSVSNKINIGNTVTLYYKTSAGQEVIFGTWKITSSKGEFVKAEPEDMINPPMIGLEARYKPQSAESTRPNMPSEPELVSKKDPGLFISDPYKELEDLGKDKPIELLDKKFPQKTAKEYAIEGDGYYSSKKYKQAFEAYRLSAQMGHAGAQRQFGLMHLLGQFVEKDPVKAFHWFKKSALQNYPLGIYSYASAFAHGQGIEKDLKKAHELYLKAANMGEKHAQFNLAVQYYNGLGITKDYLNARKWFEKASDQNIKEAFFALGLIYEKGQGVNINQEKAMSYFKKAADLGHGKAARKLEQ